MNQKIPTTPLAPKLKISQILTGLWQIADMERDGQSIDLHEAARDMQPYLDAGLTTFDMADHYGSAELIAGIFRQSAGEDQVQLLTKWVPTPGKGSKEEVRAAIQKSLDRLQMEQLDLLQYHAWNYADPAWLDDLFWLQELQKEGLIKHLGVTNFDTAHLNMAVKSGIRIVSNQICYSLLDQRAAGAMTELCQKENIKILAFGTLAGGFLSEKWLGKEDRPVDQLQTWSQMKYKRFIDVAGGWEPFQNLLQVLDGIAKKYRISIPNVATKYILSQPAVGGIIIGARLGKSRHIEDNLRLFDFELDEDSTRQIQDALSQFLAIPGDCGDEYRKPPFLTASGDLSHHLDNMPPPYPTEKVSEDRTKALSGTIWEDLAGFSRAVRKGNRILVSGTTATHREKVIGGKDPAAQTHFIIDKIEGAIQSLGGKLEDVVRTRVFIQNMSDWEPISRAHGQRFRHIQPANTLVKVDLVGKGYLVEIEAEAIIEDHS
jgi:aryl-alcohol dehydrogenase-like predicted oxidoreductase/enamine deaminase RidA (YjgF/YER057c/UK114 family)